MSNATLDLPQSAEMNEAEMISNGHAATDAPVEIAPPDKNQVFECDESTGPSAEDAALAELLSEEDQASLNDFNLLVDLLRTRTRSVALGYQNGVYLVGRPGTSKSHTVIEELARIEANYIMKNAKMTAPGLWELMNDNREKVIVLDDIPSLASERSAQQMLLAALGGKKGEPRLITYTSAEVSKGRRSFEFSGGIIAISNVPLRHDPLAAAIASRIPTLEHEPTDAMLAAFMRLQALKGYKSLSPEECRGVVEFVISASKASEMRLDLRGMTLGWEDYRQCKEGNALCNWQELVLSSMKQTTRTSSAPITRREEQDRELKIAEELLQKYPGVHDAAKRNQEWTDLTGKSFDTLLRYHRRLRRSTTV